MGNALRRVLLSSMPGAAITSVKIDGVLHEFSTIPGVKEDTTELLLNLKDLNIKMERRTSDSGRGAEDDRLRIDPAGKGEVTGADVQCPRRRGDRQPGGPHRQISDETAALIMEMTVEIGKGYVLPDNAGEVQEHHRRHPGRVRRSPPCAR